MNTKTIVVPLVAIVLAAESHHAQEGTMTPHNHVEVAEAEQPVGQAASADQASATVTGTGGFPIGAFTGPDRPHLAKPHRVQNAMMNDNLSWLPLTGLGKTRGGTGG
jgi:hypothetical protein